MYFPLFFPLRAETRETFCYSPPTTLSSSLAEVRFASLVAWAYIFIVVLTSACPRSSCTSLGAAPFDSRLLVNVWRSWWKWKSSNPSTFFLAALHIIPTVLGDSNAPSGLRQTKAQKTARKGKCPRQAQAATGRGQAAKNTKEVPRQRTIILTPNTTPQGRTSALRDSIYPWNAYPIS